MTFPVLRRGRRAMLTAILCTLALLGSVGMTAKPASAAAPVPILVRSAAYFLAKDMEQKSVDDVFVEIMKFNGYATGSEACEPLLGQGTHLAGSPGDEWLACEKAMQTAVSIGTATVEAAIRAAVLAVVASIVTNADLIKEMQTAAQCSLIPFVECMQRYVNMSLARWAESLLPGSFLWAFAALNHTHIGWPPAWMGAPLNATNASPSLPTVIFAPPFVRCDVLCTQIVAVIPARLTGPDAPAAQPSDSNKRTAVQLCVQFLLNATLDPNKCQTESILFIGGYDAKEAALHDRDVIVGRPGLVELNYQPRELSVVATVCAGFPTAVNQQCDEYPFKASTQSTPAPGQVDFRWINAGHNFREGVIYRAMTNRCGHNSEYIASGGTYNKPLLVIPVPDFEDIPTFYVCGGNPLPVGGGGPVNT